MSKPSPSNVNVAFNWSLKVPKGSKTLILEEWFPTTETECKSVSNKGIFYTSKKYIIVSYTKYKDTMYVIDENNRWHRLLLNKKYFHSKYTKSGMEEIKKSNARELK